MHLWKLFRLAKRLTYPEGCVPVFTEFNNEKPKYETYMCQCTFILCELDRETKTDYGTVPIVFYAITVRQNRRNITVDFKF